MRFTFCWPFIFPNIFQFPLNTITNCQNYGIKQVFVEEWCLKMQFFHFCNFFHFLRVLARKLMKRPVVSITYFQSLFQIVHVYQVLHSEYYFWKFHGCFKIIFFAFQHFCEKTYEKTYQFYHLFSKFLLICARSQIFVVWKFFKIKWRLFQNVNNLLFISGSLSNICNKTYEKTYIFF